MSWSVAIGILGKALSLSRTVLSTVFKRVFGFFTTGIQSYIFLSMIVLIPFFNLDYVPLDSFIAIFENAKIILTFEGQRLAGFDSQLAASIQSILTGQGSYISNLVDLLNATFGILWHLRTFSLLQEGLYGSDIPPFAKWPASLGAYFVLVWAISGDFPLALWELVRNSGEIFTWDHVNPLADPGVNSTNVSNSSA